MKNWTRETFNPKPLKRNWTSAARKSGLKASQVSKVNRDVRPGAGQQVRCKNFSRWI
jgi:hypothetical protein